MRQVKTLLAVSFSVFLLAMSFALLTGRTLRPNVARAQVDPGATGVLGIIPVDGVGFGYRVDLLLDDGRVLRFDSTPGPTTPYFSAETNIIGPLPPLPVPASEIKFWTPWTIVTRSDVFWSIVYEQATGTYAWHSAGVPPGLPVPAGASSVGDLKAIFGARK